MNKNLLVVVIVIALLVLLLAYISRHTKAKENYGGLMPLSAAWDQRYAYDFVPDDYNISSFANLMSQHVSNCGSLALGLKEADRKRVDKAQFELFDHVKDWHLCIGSMKGTTPSNAVCEWNTLLEEHIALLGQLMVAVIYNQKDQTSKLTALSALQVNGEQIVNFLVDKLNGDRGTIKEGWDKYLSGTYAYTQKLVNMKLPLSDEDQREFSELVFNTQTIGIELGVYLDTLRPY